MSSQQYVRQSWRGVCACSSCVSWVRVCLEVYPCGCEDSDPKDPEIAPQRCPRGP